MGERWIYSFRRTGSRALTEGERERLRAMARKHSRRRYALGTVAVLIGILSILGIAVAAGGASWGWAVLVGGFGLFGWVMSHANRAEHLSLLFGRTARKGVADTYVRDKRTPEVWRAHRRAISDAQEPPTQPVVYWEADERFERKIALAAGLEPSELETPADDDVLITVQGHFLEVIIDVPALDL